MQPFFRSAQGVNYFWKDEGDHKVVHMVQDTDDIVDHAKAQATHNDGYSPSRELRRVATIPAIVALKWLHEEGWWMYDPNCAERLKRKLNDPDWRYLRTAPGEV